MDGKREEVRTALLHEVGPHAFVGSRLVETLLTEKRLRNEAFVDAGLDVEDREIHRGRALKTATTNASSSSGAPRLRPLPAFSSLPPRRNRAHRTAARRSREPRKAS